MLNFSINPYIDSKILEFIESNFFILNQDFFDYFNLIYQIQIENRDKNKLVHETHHIIPTCFKGNNSRYNKVILTYDEHYLVHKYLTGFTTGTYKSKMIYAFTMLSTRYISNNIVFIEECEYKNLKTQLAQIKSENFRQEKNPMFGRKHTPETIEKIRQAGIGRPSGMLGKKNVRSEKGKLSFFEKMSGDKNSSKRPEVRIKISENKKGSKNPMYGKDFSIEHRTKLSESKKGDRNPAKKPGVGKVISESKKDRTIYHWIHPQHGEELLTRHQLAEKYPDISINKLSDVIRRNSTHRKWSIKKESL